MRIEQRVGRLSRIGQTRDNHIINQVTAGTVEESVLHLLQAKLNLFEMVIGEIDMILGNLEDEEREFEDVVADLWAESADMGDFRRRMEDLGERLVQAKAEYQGSKPPTTRSLATALPRISARSLLPSGAGCTRVSRPACHRVSSWTAPSETRFRLWRRSCATTWTRPAVSGTSPSRKSTT